MPSHGFWSFAEEHPERIAVVDASGYEVAAGALLAAANQLVHGLREHGVQRGDVLVVALRSRVEFLELYMAALQAGWYFAPISPALAPPEVAYILKDSGASALFFDETSALAVSRAVGSISFPEGRCHAVGADYDALKVGRSRSSPSDRSAGDRMYYTSGSTGRPKAVVRALSSISPESAARAAAFHLRTVAGIRADTGEVHLVCSPLHHSASLVWCIDQLHLGHRVVLMEKWTPEGMLECVERHRVTAAFMVPTHFNRLLALPEDRRKSFDVSTLRHVVHGGAPCSIELKRKMLEWWGPVIYEVYGAAEGPGTRVGPEEWLARPGTVGKGNVRILRDDGSECAPREIGTVYLRSSGSPFAYHNDPLKTEAGRRGDAFTVDDVGYLDEDGYLFLCDRKSDVIISGGVNIYPAEVEAALLAHPKVGDAVVFGIPDDEWGERVKAMIEPVPGADPNADLEQELLVFCRERLASLKCPRAIEFVDALPRDETGKLSRRRLRDPHWVGRERKI